MRQDGNRRIVELAAGTHSIRNRDVAKLLSISRQAAHKRLKALVEAGELVRGGAGRGACYRRPGPRRFAYSTAGLEEDRVWSEVSSAVPELEALSDEAAGVFSYAVTELVNNAIDHSGAAQVEVLVDAVPGIVAIEVIDEGVGLFEHVRRTLALDSELDALGELSKGKITTMPERHTGEGLFFVSKSARRFEAESGGLAWIVDNEVGDVAFGAIDPPRVGTLVRFEARPDAPPDLGAIFAEYTRGLRFARTRTVVKLFATGDRFVSRSEAKRLLRGLERFEEVVLDFGGVTAVGQGFVDEVFRVWARAHPEVRLLAESMSAPVAFLVERGRRAP